MNKKKRVLSLFSGCGGMDIGFEGGFRCLKRSINTDIHPDWIAEEDGDWISVAKTGFETVFANDIRPDAKAAWVSYFSSIYDNANEIYHIDMETRLYRLYDEIEGVENSIEEVKNRLLNIRQQKISEENVYQFLLYFDKLYDKFTDLEKKEFLNSFVEQVDIYEQEQPDGRFLKHIKFRFPVYFGDRETQELCWDNESTVESVVLLTKAHK